eukprot:GHVO01057451.1.p2 GENE.GHVO01057451.1~~GHVO01057451.1.p2  ORF type:complete len:144 (+),score=11.10 GHVO01057451.1:246-677(+)
MPKNKGKGGKNRRRGKNESDSKRDFTRKEDGQEYGQVLRMLGNARVEANCFDGVKRLCHIRGKMRKRVWVNSGDIVLISLRDFQDCKGDIIQKYSADECRALRSQGMFPSHISFKENEATGFESDHDNQIVFDEQAGLNIADI